MATIVVGGHSRSVGKTSVVAGLIAALREHRWAAVKITQYGHGVCSINGENCGCAVDDHTWAITEETDPSGPTDTSRFLAAGALPSLWVRTKQGRLAEAMPELRQRLQAAQNVIIESNSVLRFLRPDLYLTVLDPSTADFKASAREYLDQASAALIHAGAQSTWDSVSLKPLAGKPIFRFTPPDYVTREIIDFVRDTLFSVTARRA
ncbi:MAG TPA: hypothetical protein VFA60_07495 [Terriglobales bacterium]|nr:hypothetical protein [Terriglobales bacterium]